MDESVITVTRYWHGVDRNNEGIPTDKTFVEYRNALVPGKALMVRLDGHINEPVEIHNLVIEKLRAK